MTTPDRVPAIATVRTSHTSRTGFHPAFALPAAAALLIGAITVVIALFAQPSRTTLIERYQHEADRAIAGGNAQSAILSAQRLIQLDPSDPLNHERLALANAMARGDLP